MSHIDFPYLLSYLAHQLDAQIRQKVEAHLAECPLCRAEVAVIEQAMGNMVNSGRPEPSSELIQQTLAAFRQSQQRGEHRTRQTAILQFDSHKRGPQSGVRGGPTDHQLLYAIDAYDMDLQITKDPVYYQFTLRGQFLGEGLSQSQLEGIELRLKNAHGFEGRGLTDGLGKFRFSNLQEGLYTLELTLGDMDVVIQDLAINQI
jgi:hypothetical protein